MEEAPEAPSPKRLKATTDDTTDIISTLSDSHNEWAASLTGLKPPEPSADARTQILWREAVAPAVTALGRIVARFIDVTAARIPPTYSAVVDTLRSSGLTDKVPEFDAEWDTLRGSSDGRAVIALCQIAASGDMLVGRLTTMETAHESDLHYRLSAHFKGQECLPALMAALRYFCDHITAAIEAATDAVPSEWPSLEELWELEPYDAWAYGVLSEHWYMAVAPAVMTLERIVRRFMPHKRSMSAYPRYKSVVLMLHDLGRDDQVLGLNAALAELRSTPGGRAVVAVCDATAVHRPLLGGRDLATMADDPRLERELKEWYKGSVILPMLLATLAYYRAGGADGGAAVATAAAAAAEAAAAAIADAAAARCKPPRGGGRGGGRGRHGAAAAAPCGCRCSCGCGRSSRAVQPGPIVGSVAAAASALTPSTEGAAAAAQTAASVP